ncbi:MAG: alpha/beta fold hydrolase [Anaerolineales bacterium]
MAIEKEISFYSGPHILAGTLTIPDSPGFEGTFPGFLLVPGSGQVDRNENAKKLAIDAFREIATDLANKGVVSLRYDKRGVGESQGDFWSTGFYDNVSDATTALHVLKFNEHVQPGHVFILGHSEGAVIATRIAATGADVAGVILLAGIAESGEDVMLWQGEQVAKGMHGLNGFLIKALHIDVQKVQRKQLDKIKQSTKDWYRVGLFAKVNAKWMREFLAYNPAEDLPKIQVPVLGITGSKDIQVDPSDLQRMAGLIKSEFEWHAVPDVTHILRAEAGEPTLSTYRQQVQRPVDGRVLNFISDWLKQHIGEQIPMHGKVRVTQVAD